MRALNRDVRQWGIVLLERLATCRAVVIGVGMPRLTLCDDADVRGENLAAQGYEVEDQNTAKVSPTTALCRQTNPDARVTPVEVRFRRSTTKGRSADRLLVVFGCVDGMVARRPIWGALGHRAALLMDGRMNAEVVRMLAVDSPAETATTPLRACRRPGPPRLAPGPVHDPHRLGRRRAVGRPADQATTTTAGRFRPDAEPARGNCP
jgi:hypothetical protein